MPGDVNPAAQASEEAYRRAAVLRPEHGGSRLTRLVEHQAAKVPSDALLVAGLGAMAASLAAELMGRERFSRFVGMWPAPLLVMGVYDKLVKTLGAR